jgi:hypothetical protein
VVELAPVPFPEPGQCVLGCAFEFGEGGEVAVDDAVADLEEGGGELKGVSGGKPGGFIAD